MPHQCLSCGRAFAQGSKELLKGCSGCKGTRFYYTAAPLDDAARAQKATETSGDLREVLAQMAREDRLDVNGMLAGKSFDDWLKLETSAKPPVPSAAAPPANPPASAANPPAIAPESTPTSDASLPPEAERQLAALLAKPEEAPTMATSVGTVHVHEPGNYTLDVERLLAASPIVIEKEGVYMIHLASAFEAPPEGAPPRRRK